MQGPPASTCRQAAWTFPAAGEFKSFQNGTFYFKPERSGASYYLSPWNPGDEALKRELRLMQYLEPAVVKASGTSDLYKMTFYGVYQPQSIAMIAPWLDVISNFPPHLDLTVFEWFRRGLYSDGRAIWAPAPFADLVNGWVVDIAAPAMSGGKVKGVAVQSVSISKLNRKYFSLDGKRNSCSCPRTRHCWA